MKKVFFVFAVLSWCLTGNAQKKISYEDARLICAQQMSAFTTAVSSGYKPGVSFEQFQSTVCGSWQPVTEGSNQLRAAYNYLVKGTRADDIIKTYNGKEIAASMKFLSDLHNKGLESDGSELFGGKTGTVTNTFGREAGPACHWYQFWCLVHGFAQWVVDNWPIIQQIFAWLGL